MNDKIKDTEKISENEEVIAEDLEDVSGGRAYITHDGSFVRPNRPFVGPMVNKYGGPDMYRPRKLLTPEEQKKLEEERKKKELEEKSIENSEIN